jgi:putative hemolysin
MTHRSDIVWIEATSHKDEILALLRENPRLDHFPVCSKTVDSVVGILTARDFLDSLIESGEAHLRTLVTKPVYLPETVTIAKALSTLSDAESPLALIIDEYGGIEGLITREHLISELAGEFLGEGETEDADVFQREDGSYLIGGQTRMDDLASCIELPPEDNADYYTLAGYLLALNGSIPKTGDRIEAGDYVCEIVDMDGHRIDKVLVAKKEEKPAE